VIQREERRKIDQLFREVADHGMSRRQMIQRAAVLGISAQALTIAFVSKAHQAVAQGAENPLGVDPEAPLDVVIFKGGYGDDYAINVNDNLYGQLYPDAEITYAGTQRLQEQYQARVVDGNPPDVMDNSGAGNFNTTSLYNEGQLADLTDLMEAPAYGQDGVTFAESLTPGTQDTGVFDGTQYYLNYVLSVWGVWFNQALLDENGWEYPQTWEDMLALCETIKADSDIAPWTYQGLYPQYMRAVYNQLVFKNGGWDAILKLDNLAEDAWTQEPSILALQGLQALYDNEYIMEGTEGLSHTESQTFWIQGDAVFLPCGAWLENEMKDVLADYPDFQMTVKPVPNLTAEDPLPFDTIESYSGEVFIVFANGKNVQGGKEWLRLLFSQEGAKFFSEATKSLTVVDGAAEGLDLGTAFASVDAAIKAAGSDTFTTRYAGWYPDLDEESKLQIGMILTGETTAEEAAQSIQALVDELRENPDIPKFTSEAPGASATPAATPSS
jgi:N-acetylglucosamine transport system substrate-binding protein